MAGSSHFGDSLPEGARPSTGARWIEPGKRGDRYGRVFEAGADLMWIPLGAGGQVLGLNGKVFEALSALVQRRPRLDLCHAALEVAAGGASYVIELAPVPDRDGENPGVVGESPAPAKCGTRTRSSPGCWSRPALTWPAWARPRVAASRAGAPDWPPRGRATGNQPGPIGRDRPQRLAQARAETAGRPGPARQRRRGEHDATSRRRGGGGHQPAARARLRLLQ